MTKIDVFDILFDNPRRVYYAGEILQGSVALAFSEPLKVNKITISIHGTADVYWTSLSNTDNKGRTHHGNTRTNHYRNWETYLKVQQIVYDKEEDLESAIPAGRHTFPFQHVLPKNLPSSFEGGYGKIYYVVKASIDRPWKVRSDEVRRAFTVVSIVDLNSQPNILSPRTGRNEKTLCCLCCQTGPISAELHIPRRGYVSGEYISIEGEVNNASNKRIKASKIQLRMMLTFRSSGGRVTRLSRTVASMKRGEIPPGGAENWSGRRLLIPPVPPSPLANCSIMSISYEVVMLIEPAGFSLNLEVPLKILIGTVPLRNTPAVYAAVTNQMSGSDPTTTQYTENSNQAPIPSFEEFAFGKIDFSLAKGSRDSKFDTSWVPVFPYFAFTPDQQQQHYNQSAYNPEYQHQLYDDQREYNNIDYQRQDNMQFEHENPPPYESPEYRQENHQNGQLSHQEQSATPVYEISQQQQQEAGDGGEWPPEGQQQVKNDASGEGPEERPPTRDGWT